MTTKETVGAEMALIPDADGVIFIKGQEKLAHIYNIKQQIAEAASEEVAELKNQIRQLASSYLQSAAIGVRRVVFLGLRGTAVSVQVTDPAKEGNRLQIDSSKMEELVKLGGTLSLGVPADQLFVREGAEAPCIVLRGPWLEWFDKNVLQKGGVVPGHQGEGNFVEIRGEQPGKLKLSAAGVEILKKLYATGSDATKTVARYLLDVGVKAFTVSADYGEK